jgi:plastocyanin
MRKALLTATAVCALAGAGFAVASLSALKQVNIRSTGFAPRTVTIAGGDTVRWRNVDTVNHQVVANSGAFASGQIRPNRTYSRRIDTPGLYPYHDALHPALKGVVRVTGNPPSISIAASVPISVYGENIHVSGFISPAAVGDTVAVYALPLGSGSFVKIADVQTTTDLAGRPGFWDYVVSPQLLTAYKAQWKGKQSAFIQVAVTPKLTLTRVGRWFVARGQAAKSLGGRWVYVQRLNRSGDWVRIKKVTLNSQGAQRFRLKNLPSGRNQLRLFITTNQAGSGYFAGPSPVLSFRRR